jgi:hypothetical protein
MIPPDGTYRNTQACASPTDRLLQLFIATLYKNLDLPAANDEKQMIHTNMTAIPGSLCGYDLNRVLHALINRASIFYAAPQV